MEKEKVYKNVELLNEDFSSAPIPKITDEFIPKLESALSFLSYRDLNMYHSEHLSPSALRIFDGCWLVDVSLKDDHDKCFAYAPFRDLQVTPNMFPNLNLKVMNLSGQIAHITKHKFLTGKERAGLMPYKHILCEDFAFLDYGKQKWWMHKAGYGISKMVEQGDYKFFLPEPISLSKGYYVKREDQVKTIEEGINDPESWYAETFKRFHLALNLSLTYYYEWSCYIKESEDSLGVRIPIHPSSSKEVFMLRNLPEGKTRRAAIVNFVKEHYRTIKDLKGNDKEILIKKHFRGELKFNWRGLQVNVTPSPYDLMKVKTKKKFNT